MEEAVGQGQAGAAAAAPAPARPARVFRLGFHPGYNLYRPYIVLLLAMGIASFWFPFIGHLFLPLAIGFLMCCVLYIALEFRPVFWTPAEVAAECKARQDQARPTPAGSRQHMVLISHYREEKDILHRTLRAVAAAAQNTGWPVHIVVACEEASSCMTEGWALLEDVRAMFAQGDKEPQRIVSFEEWDIATARVPPHDPADAEASRAVVTVQTTRHPRGLPGERPGLGSNLRWAIHEFVARMEAKGSGEAEHAELAEELARRTMVTKLDCNAFPLDDVGYFLELERAWAKPGRFDGAPFSTSVCFQPLIPQFSDKCEEWATDLNPAKAGMCNIFEMLRRHLIRYFSFFGSIAPVAFTKVFRNQGLFSSFCIPLELLCKSGNWDPWLVQEDLLMGARMYFTTGGKTEFRWLRSPIFQAPVLDLANWFKQMDRTTIHGWVLFGWDFQAAFGLNVVAAEEEGPRGAGPPLEEGARERQCPLFLELRAAGVERMPVAKGIWFVWSMTVLFFVYKAFTNSCVLTLYTVATAAFGKRPGEAAPALFNDVWVEDVLPGVGLFTSCLMLATVATAVLVACCLLRTLDKRTPPYAFVFTFLVGLVLAFTFVGFFQLYVVLKALVMVEKRQTYKTTDTKKSKGSPTPSNAPEPTQI